MVVHILRRQRQVDLCELEASLVYRASSRQLKVLHRETLSQKKKKIIIKKKVGV